MHRSFDSSLRYLEAVLNFIGSVALVISHTMNSGILVFLADHAHVHTLKFRPNLKDAMSSGILVLFRVASSNRTTGPAYYTKRSLRLPLYS